VPRKAVHTAIANQYGQPSRSKESQFGSQYVGSCQAIHTRMTQRVQPGTKRPSGKRYRNMPKEARPRKSRRESGHHKEVYSIDSADVVLGKPAVPKVSRPKETSIAMGSTDLRQKMMAATKTYTVAKTTSSTTA
jgi:hypothetical protein